MDAANSSKNDFTAKLKEIIEANLTNPQFGVSMLAKEMEMSRSNLHRKVFLITKLSVSQFINRIRLQHAKDILRHSSQTVSDVAHQTGFNNTSYFIKRFHEYYGYTPGEVGNRKETESDSNSSVPSNKKKLAILLVSAVSVVVFAFVLSLVFKPFTYKQNDLEKSIAVLPPHFDSNDSVNVYAIDGLMTSIHYNLCKIKVLTVKSITSTEKYRNNPKLIFEIAKELDVNYVVEGRGQKIGNQTFIAIYLNKATSDENLWAQKYEIDDIDIIDLPIKIAKTIAEKLKADLSSEEIKQIEKQYTQNTEAYQLYLKGRYFWFRRTHEDLKQSVNYFNRALELDSKYSLAYAGLADAYFIMAYWEWLSGEEVWNKSKEYALKSIKIDNNLAEAHAVLGGIATWYDKNWELASKELKLAIELDPNNAIAHQYYGEYLRNRGNHTEAINELNLAIKLNPNAPAIYSIRAYCYYDIGKFNEALNDLKKVSELHRYYLTKNISNFKIYVRKGEDLKAIDEIETIILNYDPGMNFKDILKDTYSKSGMEGVIHWTIDWLLTKKANDNSTGLFNDDLLIAQLYSLTAEKDSVLLYLERFAESNSVRTAIIKNSIDFKFLHDDPRFNALLKKIDAEVQ